MLSFVLRRILYSIPVLIIASFMVFCFTRATFDPTAQFATSRDRTAVERDKVRLGLNHPLVVQYWNWGKGAVHGNFGESRQTNEAVSSMIKRSLGSTLQLIGWGALLSAILAVFVGVYSAVRQYSISDYLFTGLSYIGIAMPPFWFGLIAIELLVVQTHVFYSVGLHSTNASGFNLDYLRHLALPVATLCVQIVASWSRFERASMLDVMGADYVRTARAKGVRERTVVMRHALRNALIPLVTVMSLDIGGLFGGLIITEEIFAIAGMGKLFFDAVLAGDVYVVEAWMLVSAVFIILFNLIADVLYGLLDPRIRLS